VNCGYKLAFVPDLAAVVAVEQGPGGRWRTELRGVARRRFRLCRNYSEENICNWVVPSEDPDPLCESCRLTVVIPNLSKNGNREAWFRLEAAKRRLIYSLKELHCPISNRVDDPERGLAYQFLSDEDADKPVLTGHAHGLITVNIAEANDAERERRRLQLREPYRTLLGHFRHEIGHYYWELLIKDGPRLEPFRALFGDEQADYDAALKTYYDQGPPADWAQRFVSTYAASHPWEDWAESWAHYLHMTDMLDTGADCGLSLNPKRRDEPTLARARSGFEEPFDQLIADWFPLTYLLNNLNRSMGLADGYPFVLSASAIDKLRFVHETIVAAEPAAAEPAAEPAPGSAIAAAAPQA
jgi:hypothetical protein